MTIGRLVQYVSNISSCSKHYRRHAVIYIEVSANLLNLFIFIVCHFRPVSSTCCFLLWCDMVGQEATEDKQGNKGIRINVICMS
jgi:hypothetical protein